MGQAAEASGHQAQLQQVLLVQVARNLGHKVSRKHLQLVSFSSQLDLHDHITICAIINTAITLGALGQWGQTPRFSHTLPICKGFVNLVAQL